MKKLTLLFALVIGFGLTSVQAQSHCDKKASASCIKKCSKSDSQADAGTADAAAKLASLDETIEPKMCEHSGKVSYSRKAVGSDGDVTYQAVSYSASTNEFVSLEGSDKKSCHTSGMGSGESASANAGKVSGKDSGAACCSKKGSSSAKSADAKPTKMVEKKSSK